MKKTIWAGIALACCGNGYAQSNVTLYGIADIGVVRESGGANGT